VTTATPVRSIDTSGTARVPFLRLVSVEWRKMLDTRGGFWLLAVTGALVVLCFALTILVVALNDGFSVSAGMISEIFTIPLSLLLPVLAILIVTSEWSQRSHMVTFTLEPSRMRVMLAKLAAVTVLSLLTIVFAFVMGALTNVICAAILDANASWNLDAGEIAWLVVLQLIYMLMGFGIAALFLNTPASIAVYYVASLLLPLMVYSILVAIFDWARELIPFIDITYAVTPFQQGTDMMGQPVDTGVVDVLRVITSMLLWVVGPIVLGFSRVLRSELK